MPSTLPIADRSFTPTADGPPPPHCLNCGAEGIENFCPRCGQEAHDLHRSLSGIFSELLDAVAGWDGKIPATLWLLVRRPGGLTVEFLAGRRARYLRPLRLYLTASVLFFLSLGLVQRPVEKRSAASTQVQFDPASQALIDRHRADSDSTPGAWVKGHLVRGAAKIAELPKEERQSALSGAFVRYAPNMIFVLLPAFALLLRILYRRSPVFYAEHFVYALHNHAFAFLALTVAHLASVWLPTSSLSALTAVPLVWMPIYFFVSLRRVYGGSRRRTTLKFLALAASYGTLLFIATVATTVMAVALL